MLPHALGAWGRHKKQASADVTILSGSEHLTQVGATAGPSSPYIYPDIDVKDDLGPDVGYAMRVCC